MHCFSGTCETIRYDTVIVSRQDDYYYLRLGMLAHSRCMLVHARDTQHVAVASHKTVSEPGRRRRLSSRHRHCFNHHRSRPLSVIFFCLHHCRNYRRCQCLRVALVLVELSNRELCIFLDSIIATERKKRNTSLLILC